MLSNGRNKMNSIATVDKSGGMDALEKVILNNDLACLSSIEKVNHVKNICLSLGLNPILNPIKLIKFQGKEVMYVDRSGTDQLRQLRGVSISKIDKEIIDGLYIVTAYAQTSDGRQDSSTGVMTIAGLKGDALANAMMKAETKAKRRVTLSICGLGFMDESEVKDASQKYSFKISEKSMQTIVDNSSVKKISEEIKEINEDEDAILMADIDDLEKCESLEQLQEKYKQFYSFWSAKRNKEALQKIISCKDLKKSELEEIKKFNEEIDGEKVS